jgi:WD40 repeat protein
MIPPPLRIWDLVSGEVRLLDIRVPGAESCAPEDWAAGLWEMEFLADGRLLTLGYQGIRIWDLEREESRLIRPCRPEDAQGLSLDGARRRALVWYRNSMARSSTLGWLDVESGDFREILSHGLKVWAAALDPTGTIVVTGDADGVVRVGPITGEAPHLLYGHALEVSSVAVSPDGKWIASGSQDGTIRLWPMPEGPPFQTLPREELLERLRALTNLRVVPDETTSTGYRVEIGPFPGWKSVPTW